MAAKRKPKQPTATTVSIHTEWTDHHGILELFGLKRSTAYHLTNVGLIKSISLREGDETRGKRLFNVRSIREYLNSRPPAIRQKKNATAKAK